MQIEEFTLERVWSLHDNIVADSTGQSTGHGGFAHAVAAGHVEPGRIREIGASPQAGSLTRKVGAVSIADLTGLGAGLAATP